MLAEGAQDLALGGREPGGPEDAEAVGKIAESGLCDELLAGAVEPLGRARGAEDLPQPPPQLGLPVQVGVQGSPGAVGVLAIRPLREHRRAVLLVGPEQLAQVLGRRVPPARPVVVCAVAEVRGQDGAPRLPHAGVDDLEQLPQHPRRRPGVVVRLDPAGCGDGLVDEPGRAGEADVRRDPVAVGGAEHGRQALRQPPLDALGRDGHDLGGERVGQRLGEDLGQRVHQGDGPLGAMEHQHGRSMRTVYPGAATEPVRQHGPRSSSWPALHDPSP